MTIQIIKMFDVHVWDGGDRQNYTASFSCEAEARKFASKYDHVNAKEIVIFDTVEEYFEFKNGDIKKKALEKLSSVERKSLGLE